MKKFFSLIPLWHIARFAALLLLAVILLKPVTELLAIKSMVVFYCGDQATLEWDPPSSGIADHYVVEATTVKPMDGSSSSVSWANYYDSNTTSLKIAIQDGYNYSFRVKAVGPTGQESPYSEEQLTVICDCSAPSLKVEPFGTGGSIRQEVLHLTGSFSDKNIASIKINGNNAGLDFGTNTWQIDIPLAEGSNSITITATDYTGNEYCHEFFVEQQPIVIASNPPGAALYLMGTPAYPGQFFINLPLKIYQVIDPSLRIPVSLKMHKMMGINRVILFPEDQDKIMLSMFSLAQPHGFIVQQLPYIDTSLTLGQIVHPFVMDYDYDNASEILAGTASGRLLLLDHQVNGENEEWNTLELDLKAHDGSLFSVLNPYIPFIIDYDNDLHYELALADMDTSDIHIFELNDDVWTQEQSIDLSTNQYSGQYFGFTDWNSDHRKDIVFSDNNGGINVALNQGEDRSPIYDQHTVALKLKDRMPEAAFILFDWDSDNKLDVISQTSRGDLAVWTNTGNWDTPSFETPHTVFYPRTIGASQVAPSAVDWNNDGITDLVIGTDSGQLFLLLGKKE
ncbi:MAG: VCBS repeat-containing protein [Deltaproteobacteria bacterium]|nr:VCBS repeat-containing protein [Deltaproteobacteria bacterium]